jgi:hypothetical protein
MQREFGQTGGQARRGTNHLGYTGAPRLPLMTLSGHWECPLPGSLVASKPRAQSWKQTSPARLLSHAEDLSSGPEGEDVVPRASRGRRLSREPSQRLRVTGASSLGEGKAVPSRSSHVQDGKHVIRTCIAKDDE